MLSRPELLTLLQDLLNGPHAKLLEELRSLLTNRGTLEYTPEDVWYSMPVGEVDFSSCPRCTPSYRALPEGYPKLACTERARWEAAECNDTWVSVPTGSEDFSFKIMRKNVYEDALFRCVRVPRAAPPRGTSAPHGAVARQCASLTPPPPRARAAARTSATSWTW